MTTAVTFKVRETAPLVTLPLTAFTEESGKTVVYVADQDSQTVRRREVLPEGVTEDGVRVKSGIAPGEIVVTAGVQFLKDGMKVRLAKEFMTATADGSGEIR